MSIISLKKSRNDSNGKQPISHGEIWNIRKSKFVQNVVIVATGAAAAQGLSIWIFIGLLNRPSINAIPALSMQSHLLAFEIFSIILRISSLYAGFYLFHDDLIAIILFSFSGVILNLVLISAVIIVSTKRNI